MDRQDIDALLIGALYGELTPAEEARLTAHLESHPADRSALDDLKSARQAVRESRIFDLQKEPPQAVSALLLQEAHRRAPRAAASSDAKEGWFYRLTRVFLAHPAMAAAAMLVLVVGVAGTLYVKKGDSFAEQKAAAPAAPEVAAPAEAPAAGRGFAETGSAAGSAYRVDLDDTVIDNKPQPTTTATAGESQATPQREREASDQPAGKLAAKDSFRREAAKSKQSIVVGTPRPQPKELDEPRAKASRKGGEARFDDAETASGGDRMMIGGGGGAAPAGTQQAAPRPTASAPQLSPPPPPPRAAQTKAAKKEAQPAPADRPAAAKDSALIAWAKAEHNRAIALAGNGDCRGAARLAVGVESRAPGYYAQYMATDRALKRCQAYVAAEREADAKRATKAPASKRATDE